MESLKSIAVPVTRRTLAAKPRRAGHPQTPPDNSQVGGEIGERRRQPRPPATASAHHQFVVGQRLRMVGSGLYWGRSGGLCRVLALMPNERGVFLYRVRSEVETFERIVAEADLAAADLP